MIIRRTARYDSDISTISGINNVAPFPNQHRWRSSCITHNSTVHPLHNLSDDTLIPVCTSSRTPGTLVPGVHVPPLSSIYPHYSSAGHSGPPPSTPNITCQSKRCVVKRQGEANNHNLSTGDRYTSGVTFRFCPSYECSSDSPRHTSSTQRDQILCLVCLWI